MNIVDKEEFRIKMNQINHLVEEKKYKDAMEVVDSIDWRRVKNVHTLCVVGEIYAANKRYEDSKEIFLLAYHRAPIGKNILYRLIEVSLKMNDIQEAEEFYEEYLEVAPNDSTQYILRYKISKASNASLEEQIGILEEYKEREFTERWSYELAKLYYQKGDTRKCLDLCNEIILWFSEGRYVMRAMDLKNRMGQLTGVEKEKYEQQFMPNLTTVEQAAEEDTAPAKPRFEAAEEDAPVIESVRIDERDVNSAESLQEKISKGIRDIFNGKKREEDDELTREEDEISQDIQEEMIKDIDSNQETEDVPELEPEESAEEMSEEPEKEEQEEEYVPSVSRLEEENDLEQSSKTMPELEIPEGLKNFDQDEPPYPSVPKAPDIVLPENETAGNEENDFEFNLEDMILSAATAQGIEIPKESEKKSEPVLEEEDEDYMSEEDLQSAEDEFLNGPADRRALEEPEEERGEDSYEDDELEDDGFYEEEEDFYEDDFYGDDEDYDQDDSEEEDDDDDDYYEDDEDDDFYEEEFEDIPPVSRKPLSSRENARIQKPDPERKTAFREETVSRKAPVRSRKRPLSQEEELERFVDSIRPQEPMDIIPREKQLTDYEKKLFTYFAKVPGLSEQLVETLCEADARQVRQD